MRRELQYEIGHEDDGKSIGELLKEKEFSRAVLIELKKDQTGIRKNGKWATVREILKIGDKLEICLKEEAASENVVPMAYPLNILYEDEDILVVNKPYDMPIHPSVNHYDNTLANAAAYYFEQKGIPYTFRCINRLDRDTTGITVIAKHLLSASIMAKRLKERAISRVYVAFAEGIMDEQGIIDLPIGRVEGSVIKRQVNEQEGKRAVTHYRRLGIFEAEGKAVSVVALKLETGRTHQIRVHLSSIGHPLLGDFLYNEDDHRLTRQALHAAECSFNHPVTGERMRISAPFHQDMATLIKQSQGCIGGAEELNTKLQNIEWPLQIVE